MRDLTRDEVDLLRRAGRNRVTARIAVLLCLGKLAASEYVARGPALLRMASGPRRVKAHKR